jgi:hypothetical protein
VIPEMVKAYGQIGFVVRRDKPALC